ncbi:Asp-tRNA(Asn)/Glu-tRNA(Gln) amidotransferase subunit GatC [soil metagenome]
MSPRPSLSHLAKLAAIELTSDEAAALELELAAIIAYVDQLGAVPTEGVPPMRTVTRGERIALRVDEPHDGLAHDEALANAPAEVAGGFAVPTFLGNG